MAASMSKSETGFAVLGIADGEQGAAGRVFRVPQGFCRGDFHRLRVDQVLHLAVPGHDDAHGGQNADDGRDLEGAAVETFVFDGAQ